MIKRQFFGILLFLSIISVITGGSDGIGKAYAKELFGAGLNLILISRTQSKLEAVRDELMAANPNGGQKIEVIAFDFGEARTADAYDKIFNAIEGKEIGILLNNVGAVTETMPHLHETDRARLLQNVIINTFPVTMLTQHVLGQMVTRNKGLVVNVSTMLASMPGPFMSDYVAGKNFVHAFTESLKWEYKKSKIDFLSLKPGAIRTKMSAIVRKIQPIHLPDVDPEEYARASLGLAGKTWTGSGHPTHQIMADGMPPRESRFTGEFAYQYTSRSKETYEKNQAELV